MERSKIKDLLTLIILFGAIPGALVLFIIMSWLMDTVTWAQLFFAVGTYAACLGVALVWLLLINPRMRRLATVLIGIALLALWGMCGYQMYIDAIPVVSDRDMRLYDYRPFSGEKVSVLPEEATLRFTREQADSFVIDGATALYPVYAAFVQAVYPEGEYLHYTPWRSGQADTAARTVLCSGTTQAYEALISGEADVIFVAEPSAQQREAATAAGLTLHLTPIGREAFVFFVNSRNPVTNLTIQQVQGIYTGEITNWQSLGGQDETIRAFQRDEGSGSQTALQSLMAGLPLIPAEKEDVFLDMGGIIRTASYKNYRNAIGYTFRFYANEMVANDQIRLLSLNGIAPTKETIRDGSYPITGCFYAVTAAPIGEPAPQETNANLASFLDWCQGDQGQKLVEAVGYVSLK